jgi:hypothetical protein
VGKTGKQRQGRVVHGQCLFLKAIIALGGSVACDL